MKNKEIGDAAEECQNGETSEATDGRAEARFISANT